MAVDQRTGHRGPDAQVAHQFVELMRIVRVAPGEGAAALLVDVILLDNLAEHVRDRDRGPQTCIARRAIASGRRHARCRLERE